MSKIASILLLWAILSACNNSRSSGDGTASLDDITLSTIEAKLLDSIKTYNDSLSFDYYNLDKLDRDTLLAFQYPVLNLSLLSGKGDFKKEISRKGPLLENFQGSFISPQWDSRHNLYLLEEGNNFSISVFDSLLHFRNRINLIRFLPDNFVFPLSTSFRITEEKDGSTRVYLSSADMRYNVFSDEYYKKANSILSFRLDSNEVSDVKHFLPFRDFDAVKKSLDDNSRTWNTPVVFFDMSDHKGFLKYKFDDNVYVCGQDQFNIEQVIPLKLQSGRQRAYSATFGNAKKTQFESAREQLLLQYANVNYNAIRVTADKIYVLYTKPVSQDKVPENPNQTASLDIVPVIHIVDLKDQKKQYSIEFSPKYNAREFSVDQSGNIYLSSNPMKEENSLIYKFSIDYHGK